MVRYYVLGIGLFALLFGSSLSHAQTPTPTPIEGTIVVPPVATFDPNLDVLNYAATLDALQAQQQSDGIQIVGNSIVRNGEIIFGATDFTTLFGYVKWITDDEAIDSLFGPFARPFKHVRLLLFIALAWLPFYFIMSNISIVIRIVRTLADLILDVFGGIGELVGGVLSGSVGGVIRRVFQFVGRWRN